MTQPFVFKLPSVNLDSKTLDSKEKVTFTNITTYPLFTLGFHSFIHRTRNAMNITRTLQSKTEFYYVVNPFENKISNYEDDLNNSNKLYLKSKQDYTNNFNKLWEVLFVFDMMKSSGETVFVDGDKELEECVELFKEKTGKSKGKDKFVKELKGKCDVYISHHKPKAEDENFLEQESYSSLLKQVIDILGNLENKGNVVLQIYDTFTIPTIKILYVLQSFFEEAYMYKAYQSRHSDTEKYLILKNFKLSKTSDVVKSLESASKSMEKNKYMADIFPELVIPRDYLQVMKFLNVKLVNHQQIMINDIVKYIKENNYFGNKYHEYRDKQIESTKWWIKNFYPPSVNLYEKNKDELEKLYKSSQEKLKSELEKFNEGLI